MSHRASRADDTTVADRLHSAAIHLLRRLRVQDVAAGLSPARLSALSVVVFAGPVSLGALASAEQVRPPTMTRLVSGLERDGLVTREADATDARVVRVRATPKGVRMLQQGRARRVRDLAARVRLLTGEEVTLLSRAAAVMEALARDEEPLRSAIEEAGAASARGRRGRAGQRRRAARQS